MKTLKTKIVKSGNSTPIKLTRNILEASGLELGDNVIVDVDKMRI